MLNLQSVAHVLSDEIMTLQFNFNGFLDVTITVHIINSLNSTCIVVLCKLHWKCINYCNCTNHFVLQMSVKDIIDDMLEGGMCVLLLEL